MNESSTVGFEDQTQRVIRKISINGTQEYAMGTLRNEIYTQRNKAMFWLLGATQDKHWSKSTAYSTVHTFPPSDAV